MYEYILRMIDVRLAQLERARNILTSPEDPALEDAVDASVDVPVQTLPTAVEPPPPVQPRRLRPRAKRETRAPRPVAMPSVVTLSGAIPPGPVYVSAAAVKAQAVRAERPVAVPAPVHAEGTLDSLIRELSRAGQAERLQSQS